MDILKGFYRLLNREFVSWTPFLAILCAGSLIVQLFLLNSAIKGLNEYARHPRYEDLTVSSGGAAVFLISCGLLCLYFLATIYSGYWGSKSVYAYLTLPVRRESLYFSKLSVFLIGLLLLIGVELLTLRIGYFILQRHIETYPNDAERFMMNNGFYLSAIRSEFVRFLLPLTFSRFMSSVSLFAAVSTGLYYAALCERSRKFAGLAAVAIAAYLSFEVFVYRLGEVSGYYVSKNLYPSSLLLLALAALFVWHSLTIMRRGAIA